MDTHFLKKGRPYKDLKPSYVIFICMKDPFEMGEAIYQFQMIDKNLLGQKIKELRSESNYTQQNIADFLGVDQSFISKVEKNERVLTSDMLEKLAVLFGVKLKDFIVGTDVRPLTYAFRANDITAEDMKTICAINKIVLNSTFLETLLDKGE